MFAPLSQTRPALCKAACPLCRYVLQTYARPELVFVHGEGPRMWDAHGKEYLDFAAGIAVNALGELRGTGQVSILRSWWNAKLS